MMIWYKSLKRPVFLGEDIHSPGILRFRLTGEAAEKPFLRRVRRLFPDHVVCSAPTMMRSDVCRQDGFAFLNIPKLAELFI